MSFSWAALIDVDPLLNASVSDLIESYSDFKSDCSVFYDCNVGSYYGQKGNGDLVALRKVNDYNL